MSHENMGRRNFGRLTLVAAGGLVAGSQVAFGQGKKDEKPDLGVDPSLLLAEPHTCKGLNSCKGEGKGRMRSST